METVEGFLSAGFVPAGKDDGEGIWTFLDETLDDGISDATKKKEREKKVDQMIERTVDRGGWMEEGSCLEWRRGVVAYVLAPVMMATLFARVDPVMVLWECE